MNKAGSVPGVLWIVVVLFAGCAEQVRLVDNDSNTGRGTRLSVPIAYAKAFPDKDSRAACEKAIEAKTTDDRLRLDVHRFTGYAAEIDSNGNRTVLQEFIARNSAGSERSYRAYCTIQPNGFLEITITEAKAG